MMVVLQNFGFFINLGASQLTKNPISIDKKKFSWIAIFGCPIPIWIATGITIKTYML